MINLKKYRITKYNPQNRNDKDVYLKDEWTSVSDIGKTFSDGTLNVKEYLEMENKYIQALNIILKENNVTNLIVYNLEKYENIEDFLSFDKAFFEKLTDNICLSLDEIEKIVSLALREVLWCKLCSINRNIEIEFGYDYYMYIKCNEISKNLVNKFLNMGIYVELL